MIQWLTIMGHRVCVALCLLYPTIVPKGIAEPWKYRKLMATERYIRFKAKGRTLERVKIIRRLRTELAPSFPSCPSVSVKVTAFEGVQVRIHQPMDTCGDLLPGFIYIHGGGMFAESSESYEPITRKLCSRLNAVVVSIDYRLAPENLFPAAYDDNLKAARWFLRNGGSYGVDVNRIAMGGDSGGGYLVTLVTQALRKEMGLPNIKAQILIYPSVQLFDFCSPSNKNYHRIFGEREGNLPTIAVLIAMSIYMMGRIDSVFIKAALKNMHTSAEFKKSALYRKRLNVTRHEHYRGSRHSDASGNENDGDDRVWERVKSFLLDPRFSPLLEKDFHGLPPALVQTCEFDTVRNDGVIYAQRLQQAGIKVKLLNYEDGFHDIFRHQGPRGFLTANRMMDDIVDFTKANV